MYDIFMNLVLLLVYGIIFVLLAYRRLESKGMDYTFTKIQNGYAFEFLLGVYAGKVRVVKRPGCVLPWFIRHVDGWEIIFPMSYDDRQVEDFILQNNPPASKNTSHSKDLDIYREVVIKRNDRLHCVAGKLCILS